MKAIGVRQFLDHDITFDRRSALNANADPARTRNFRTAAFDLDSVYGEGPERSSELYDTRSGDYRLRVDEIPGSPAMSRKGAVRHDLPRDASGEALVGDSRNDENVILSQLHVAMLKFHNAVVDHLRRHAADAGVVEGATETLRTLLTDAMGPADGRPLHVNLRWFTTEAHLDLAALDLPYADIAP